MDRRRKTLTNVRTEQRPRRYVRHVWLVMLGPLLRYSYQREAFVLRLVGRSAGPVLREDRRARRRPSARFDGVERRHPSAV